MGYMRRRGVIGWLIVSGVCLLLYIFSVGWRAEYTTGGLPQRSCMLLDGAIIISSFEFTQNRGPRFRTGLYIQTASWFPSIFLLPRFVSPTGFWEVRIPLWCLTLPVWIVSFVKWRRHRVRSQDQCEKCGYDLRGLEKNVKRCPECGRAIVEISAGPRS